MLKKGYLVFLAVRSENERRDHMTHELNRYAIKALGSCIDDWYSLEQNVAGTSDLGHLIEIGRRTQHQPEGGSTSNLDRTEHIQRS